MAPTLFSSALVAVFAVSGLRAGHAQLVTTLAGAVGGGYADGQGTAANFSQPSQIVAVGGNLYVTDEFNNDIRLLAAGGSVTVTTFAGATTGGTSGHSDGQGTQATFSYPFGITSGPNGTTLFVADRTNNMIRQIVIASATVTTLAGTTTSGNNDGQGIAASFSNPHGVAADALGNVFVADTYNSLIRQIVVATSTVTTLAGGASSGQADGIGTAASFNTPYAVAVSAGNLFVADTYNNVIRQVIVASGVVTTLAGAGYGLLDGTGTAAQFFGPVSIAVDSLGVNLYVADEFNCAVRQVVISTRVVTTLAGSGAPGRADGSGTAASFDYPAGIAVSGIYLYVADTGNNLIRKITLPAAASSSSATATSSSTSTASSTGTSSSTSTASSTGTSSSTSTASSTGTSSSSSSSTGTSTASSTSTSTGTSTSSSSATSSPTSTGTSTASSSSTASKTLTATASPAAATPSPTAAATPSPHCIAAGAPVLLANGSVVPIETLAAGAIIATPKGPVPVIALHGHHLTAVVAKQHVLHFAAGSLGSGLPDSSLTVTDEHGFAHPATGSWTLFKQVEALASAAWPAGTSDADGGLMVYQVALDTDDPRPILVAGLQVASWTRGYPDRAEMPVVA